MQVNINPKTGIKLAKRERDKLTEAQAVVRLIAKHGDGELMACAEKVADEMDLLMIELADQGKSEEELTTV